MDLRRRSESIVETKLFSVSCSGRTTPSAIPFTAVTIGALLGQLLQLILVFALLPACRTAVNHEVIRSMHDRQASRAAGLVLERNRRRLVVILQHIRVVLHLINEGQLHTMAFKLDRHAHLSAGIAPAHILTSAADPPRRTGRSNRRDGRLRFPRQAQPFTPKNELLVTQHLRPFLTSRIPPRVRPTAGDENGVRSSTPEHTCGRLPS